MRTTASRTRAPCSACVSPSGARAVGEALGDLRPGEARPRADVDLAQSGVGDDREAMRRRRGSRPSRMRGGGRTSTPRRRRSPAAARRARAPARGRCRSSGGSAQPCQRPFAVPVGLAVPCEEEGRHRPATVATRGPGTRQARCASSPARPPASGSRSRGGSRARARSSSRPGGARAGPGSCTSPADLTERGAAERLVARRGRAVRPHRPPRQQRRRHRDPQARRADRRRLAALVRAEPDDGRADDACRTAAHAARARRSSTSRRRRRSGRPPGCPTTR